MELRNSRVGRRARLKGEVVSIVPPVPPLPHPSQNVAGRQPSQLVAVRPSQDVADRPARPAPRPAMAAADGRSGLKETELARFRRDFPGLDVPWLEREFRE
jgi:hypothetical protein